MYNAIQTSMRTLMLMLVGSLFIGCAGQVNMRPTLTAETVVEPQQGIVVARFVNAGNFPLPFNQMTIAPKNVNESDGVKPDRLEAIEKAVDGNSVFAAPVDAGSYALSSFGAFHVFGEVIYSKYAPADATFGTFDVRPGQVTDLGTIVYYPKPAGDKYEDILVRVPDSATGETLDAHAPFRPYQKDALLTWDADGFDDDRQSLYVSIVQNPVNFETVYRAPDGTILFLAPLGVILERDSSGNWGADAVDTNLQMFAVAQNEAGDRAVAGSEGRIFFRSVGGEWQDVSLNTDAHIDSLRFGSDGQLIALVRKTNSLAIKARSSDGTWSDVNTFVEARGWDRENSSDIYVERRIQKPRRMDAAKFRAFEGRQYVEMGMRPPLYHRGTAMKERTFLYDPDTFEMQGIDKPKEVLYETDAGALKLAVKEAGFFSWTGKPKYLRSDAEQGWVELTTQIRTCDGVQSLEKVCSDGRNSKRKPLNLVSAPWFRDESHGVVTARLDVPPLGDGEAWHPRVLTTDDGGASWTLTDHDLPKPYCASLVTQVADRLLLSCRGANGDFFESFDDGASWTQVREHQNF